MTGLPGEDGQLDDAEERIESYLDELLLTLRGRPREARRLLSEVDSHLRESIEAGLAAWWVLHVHRKAQPALLPAGFAPIVCSTLLGGVAAFLLAFGIADVAHGIDSTGGLIGSGDLVATGATMMITALLAWAALARQATRPARSLTAGPHP